MDLKLLHSCKCAWCPFSSVTDTCYPKVNLRILFVQEAPDIEWKRVSTPRNVLHLVVHCAYMLFSRTHHLDFRPIRIRVPMMETRFYMAFFVKYVQQIKIVEMRKTSSFYDAVPLPFSSALFPQQNEGMCVLRS